MSNRKQAQNFSRQVGDDEDEEDLREDSVLLESPLDKIEPYQLFRGTLMSKLNLIGYTLRTRANIACRNATRAAPVLLFAVWPFVGRGAECFAEHRRQGG